MDGSSPAQMRLTAPEAAPPKNGDNNGPRRLGLLAIVLSILSSLTRLWDWLRAHMLL